MWSLHAPKPSKDDPPQQGEQVARREPSGAPSSTAPMPTPPGGDPSAAPEDSADGVVSRRIGPDAARRSIHVREFEEVAPLQCSKLAR